MTTTSDAKPTRAEASPYSRHVPALDGVRGLAILLVMGSHLFPGTPHNFSERMAGAALGLGVTGVDLFFVLSGFLITGILYDSLQDDHFFRKFYARRALRILPLYYGVIAVYAAIGLIQHRPSHGELFSLAFYLQNTGLIATPIFSYAGPLLLPLGHFWSLAIEEQFYLLWPLLVFLLRTRARILALCATLILLCPVVRFLTLSHGASYLTVHVNTLCRADSLAIGAALSMLLRSRWHDRVLSTAGWLLLAIPLLEISAGLKLLSPTFARHDANLALGALSYSLLAFGYAGLLVLALGSTAGRGLFSLKSMRFFGKYSYGLYVLHLILLSYLDEPLRSALREMHVGRGLSVALIGIVGFALSIAVAVITYQLYERHFLRLKRFFDYRAHDRLTLKESVSIPALAADAYRRTPQNPQGLQHESNLKSLS